LRVVELRHDDRQYRVPAFAENVRAEGGGDVVRLNADVILALVSLLHLWEEHEIPWRDRFGLVEGTPSPRHKLGVLSEPLLENTATWLSAVLEIPRPARYPGGATWAVAFSSDIDVLTDDHLPNVLAHLDQHGVEQPTFMICPPSPDERTIRDPDYDFANEEIRARLRPVRDGPVEIGLHGSYLAHDRLDLLTAQKRRLEDWAGRAVIGHRAHFYRFAYPRSWAWQARAGLQYDASLGYPDLPGLRGGTAAPTPFLDPEHGPVAFQIVPTVVLDQHFFWPDAWDVQAFERYADTLLHTIRQVGGLLTLDWHSYTRGVGYAGWWDRLDALLTRARAGGAYLAGIATVLRYHATQLDSNRSDAWVGARRGETRRDA
jgi:hypothetical protein